MPRIWWLPAIQDTADIWPLPQFSVATCQWRRSMNKCSPYKIRTVATSSNGFQTMWKLLFVIFHRRDWKCHRHLLETRPPFKNCSNVSNFRIWKIFSIELSYIWWYDSSKTVLGSISLKKKSYQTCIWFEFGFILGISEQFSAMFRRKAFLHWYTGRFDRRRIEIVLFHPLCPSLKLE